MHLCEPSTILSHRQSLRIATEILALRVAVTGEAAPSSYALRHRKGPRGFATLSFSLLEVNSAHSIFGMANNPRRIPVLTTPSETQ